MKTSSKIDTASTTDLQDEKILAASLAKAQWALIRDFERQYIGKTVSGTNCKFEDDSWFSRDSPSTSSRVGINWQLLVTGGPAMQIFAKAFLFDAISERRLEIGTAVTIIRNLRNSMIPLIENKNLLTSQGDSVLLGLTHLTDEDFLLMLDAELVSQISESVFYNYCYAILAFHTFANHIAEQIPVYRIRAHLPWQKSNESVHKWAKKRAIDLGVMFSKTEGFEPLPSETMQPLVEKSLSLIDLYFNDFAEIAPIVALHNKHARYERAFVLGLLKKYSPIFGPIMAAPDISKKVDTQAKGRMVLGWLREVLYLARGACVNVILLTTGLRNNDVRGLKVGSWRPSGRIDMLFYLSAYIQKTKNWVLLPIPGQTDKALRLLEKIKLTKSANILDAVALKSSPRGSSGRADTTADIDEDAEEWIKNGSSLNEIIRDFSAHFNIPFTNPISGEPISAHCYRTTVAGWLGSASNLSLLLVRRLFGHSNNVMPTIYLNNNPAFVAERQAQKERAHVETARSMGLAASQGRLAGIKGEQLERGYRAHKSLMEAKRQTSHSLTDAEILKSFNELLEQRINSGSVCAFLTPFGVQCMRNPSDTSQPPCAKRANRDKTKDIDAEILKHFSDINPQQCIGTSCTEAVLGPWSTSVLGTLNWYRALLSHQLGDAFTEEHFIESAKAFIQQYQAPLKKVFGIAAFTNNVESSPSREKVV